MAKKEDKESKKSLEEEVWNAISAFEQILEAIPNDRASLEALCHAYGQIGDQTQAKDYLIRLGNVLVDEADIEAARQLLEKIKEYSDKDPLARELAVRIEKLTLKPEVGPSETEAEPWRAKGGPGERARTGFNIAEELSFAWNLMEAKELTQEEYAGVVQDLTDMSAADSATTVSVLHVLEGRRFKNLEKIICFVSKECGTPSISLAGFDFQPEAVSILPMDFMVRRGALVFELFGKDALVVVMNPYDKQLRKDVKALAGRNCHFFVTMPSEFDGALEKIPEILGRKASSAE